MSEKLPKALYKGKLPIGNIELDCFVLDNDQRILTAKTVFEAFGRPRKGINSRLEINGTKLPPFIASNNLKPYITDDIKECTKLISFVDGSSKKTGYPAKLLPAMCEMYLKARREKALTTLQERIAEQSEILQSAFATIGIIALIDEATGFQQNRKSDALRLLLQAYLAEGIKKWVKEFPDDFFFELDRLYGNQNLKSNKRPQYYGTFINTYVYEPIEKGKINPELQKRYIGDNKKRRKHQHFTDFGSNQLRIQIGKILGLLQVAPNLNWFKEKQSRQGQLSLFPDID